MLSFTEEEQFVWEFDRLGLNEDDAEELMREIRHRCHARITLSAMKRDYAMLRIEWAMRHLLVWGIENGDNVPLVFIHPDPADGR